MSTADNNDGDVVTIAANFPTIEKFPNGEMLEPTKDDATRQTDACGTCEMDDDGEAKPVPSVPAKDVMDEMDKSWRRLNDFARPIVRSVGRGADKMLRGMNVFDKWRRKRATPVPVIAVFAILYYFFELSIALVIRDRAMECAWEELFVITTFVFEWVFTTKALRTFVAGELSAARMRRDPEDEAINRLAALAQADPMTVVIVIGILIRMVVRLAIFSIRPLFVAETVAEVVLVFVFTLYMVLIVASSSRRRASTKIDVELESTT